MRMLCDEVPFPAFSANFSGVRAAARCLVLCALYLSTVSTHAQSDWQSWNEVDVIYPFANIFSVDTEVSYQTLLSSEGKWRSINATPTLEASVTPNIDLTFAVPLSHTWQTEDFETGEVRLALGSRVHFTPNRRARLRLYPRYEYRFALQEQTDSWQKSDRLRIRAEAIISINRRRFYEDKQWYGIVDYELFLARNNDVEERYANRFRARTGLGYRFNYTVRVELIYALQRSRNTMDAPYSTTDHILRLRLKYYLRGSKPTDKEGSAN